MNTEKDHKILALEMELDYNRRKCEYDLTVEELRQQREKFYEENPDFPYKYMYMQVTAPPQKVTFQFITH